MGKPQVVIRKLADLKVNLFVRKQLNEDWVLQMSYLIQAGEKLPPIEILADNTIVEGRHRVEGHQVAGKDEIECVIVEFKDELDMISHAYQANTGGSMPPSQADTEHTITLLLERGATKAAIGRLLGLPSGVARTYINSVQSRINRTKLMSAVDSVAHGGVTVPKAAQAHGVDVDKLRAAISGRKKKGDGFKSIMGQLTRNSRSYSQRTAAMFRKLFERREDGDVSRGHVEKL